MKKSIDECIYIIIVIIYIKNPTSSSDLASSYFKMRVKNTIMTLMVEECVFTNGVAYKTLESIFGIEPSFVGGVCQTSADGNYFFTVTKDGANLKIIMSNLAFSGKYWITAILVGTM